MARKNSLIIRALLKVTHILELCWVYFIAILNTKSPEIKFLIFGQGRTGSTLLVELLNQIEGIYCDEELLNKRLFPIPIKIPFPYLYVKGRSKMKKKRVYGFKVKIFQLEEHQFLDPSTFIKKMNKAGYRIIYLYRRNLKEQVLSNLLALHNSKFHVANDENYTFRPFKLDIDDYKRRKTRRKEALERERSILVNYDHLKLCYEEDLLHEKMHKNCIDKICSFLSIDSNPVIAPLKKSNIFKEEEIIENYLEVKDYL